jgi:hypothetical protein
MELLALPGSSLEYDRLATIASYKLALANGPERCNCDPCRNWVATRCQLFPKGFLDLLNQLGISSLSAANSLRNLGMQVAFVLPLSMPLLVPVGIYRLTWFFPGMMVLLGAHYLPFAFLYGMRMFLMLAALLTGGGLMIAMYWSSSFSIGAWYTGLTLLAFAAVGRAVAEHEYRSIAKRSAKAHNS